MYNVSLYIIGYIKDNDYTLIDVSNQTTTWGVWSPGDINYNQSWADEHGLNSLEILTGLLAAYRMTGKKEYLTSWKVCVYTCTTCMYVKKKIYVVKFMLMSSKQYSWVQFYKAHFLILYACLVK